MPLHLRRSTMTPYFFSLGLTALLLLAGCPTPDPGGGEGEGEGEGIAAMESSAAALVNGERVAEGLDPLTVDAGLSAVARAHSEDMVARDFFAHNNPDGESPFDRIDAAGITYSTAGENIAWNNFSNAVETAVESWMNSPGHRANILNPDFTLTGMGIAEGDEGKFYFTQVFTRPLAKGAEAPSFVVRTVELLPPPISVEQ